MILGGTLFSFPIKTQNYWVILFLYSVLNPVGFGMIYMLPVRNAWLYYPKKKGMVFGVILMMYSVGAIFWGLLTTFLANPSN